MQHDTITVTPPSPTTGTGTGPYQAFFDTGTIKLTAHPPSDGVAPYTGAAKISGGTGAYKYVRGSSTSQCSSPDGETHTNCTPRGR